MKILRKKPNQIKFIVIVQWVKINRKHKPSNYGKKENFHLQSIKTFFLLSDWFLIIKLFTICSNKNSKIKWIQKGYNYSTVD